MTKILESQMRVPQLSDLVDSLINKNVIIEFTGNEESIVAVFVRAEADGRSLIPTRYHFVNENGELSFSGLEIESFIIQE